MKRQSYKIKHDFLFDSDDGPICINKYDSTITDANRLKLTDVLNSNSEETFMKLVDCSKSNVVIIDDIGQCTNPASKRYKQFIIRCICRKLLSHNFNIFK